ncbi:hypothetical protein A2U01_0097333, partial [Trifolium medium]|nr:hypothetical protein [Trifolium medium]
MEESIRVTQGVPGMKLFRWHTGIGSQGCKVYGYSVRALIGSDA